MRASLEVPENGSPANTTKSNPTISGHPSVTSDGTPPSTGYATDANGVAAFPSEEANGTFSEPKRESLGRSSRFPQRKTGGQGSLGGKRMSEGMIPRDSVGTENGEYRGVQLSDRPMDDD